MYIAIFSFNTQGFCCINLSIVNHLFKGFVKNRPISLYQLGDFGYSPLLLIMHYLAINNFWCNLVVPSFTSTT